MGSIVTTFSSVSTYIDQTSGEYSIILNQANDIRSRVEKRYQEVQSDLAAITRQIGRGKGMLDEIQVKVNKYRALMEEAAAEVERCQERVNYVLSHPIERTYTDEDGNEHTEKVVDQAALAEAERAKDRAVAEYEQYREKFERAEAVKSEIESTVSKFEMVKGGIEKVAQSIQSDLYEIKKYISAIGNESEHNLKSLDNLTDLLEAYLACKPFSMPNKTVFSDYSAKGGFTKTYAAPSTGGSASSGYSASSGVSGFAGSASVPSADSAVLNEVAAASASVRAASPKAVVKPCNPIVNPKAVAERYFDKQSKRDAKSLSYSESRYLQIYLNNNDLEPAYRKINGHLVKGDHISDELTRTIDSMTDTLSKHTLKRDMVLYRGMRRSAAERIFGKMSDESIQELKDRLEGCTYIEKGFSSTSILERDALEYTSFKGVLFEIKAPGGAEGIFTKDIANYAQSEHEVLLQRGGIFSVDKVSDRGDYYLIGVTLTGRHISNE